MIINHFSTMKGTYVDGFLVVVPKANSDAYKNMATLGKETWLEHGALAYLECRGDDLYPKVPEGMEDMKARSFMDTAGAAEDESVWFSFIVFRSKEHRDEVNAKVMSDPRMNDPEMHNLPMPFDVTRMSYGGFTVEVGGGL